MFKDLMSVIGSSFILYIFSYLILLMLTDCDVSLLFASIYGKRNLNKFNGKVIWVTGASSGIGEYIARLLSKYGAKLVLTARNKTELERVKKICLESGKLANNDILVLPMDVTDISKHQSAFDKVLQQFNKLDILINNAGRSQRALWENIELQVDRDMFELNVFSNISLSRIALKHFSGQRGGHIVLTSSLAGIMPVPFSPTYSGTKFALHGYYGSLLKEKFQSDLKVTLLCPGPVNSNLLPACFTDKAGEQFGQSHQKTESRMSTERCAYLSLIAIANNLSEAWMAKFPLMFIAYLYIYCPNFAWWLYKLVGAKTVQHLRDQQVTVQQSQQ